MPVDVKWDGVLLTGGANARDEGGGWFVELEQPMPVGTRIELSGDVQATVTVARVQEGLGAGMLLKRVDSRQSTVDSAPEKSEAPAPEKEEGKKEKRKKRR